MSDKHTHVDERIIAAMLNGVTACKMEINGIENVFADSDAEESVGFDDGEQSSDEDAAGPLSLPMLSSDEDESSSKHGDAEEEPMSLGHDDEAVTAAEVIVDAEDEAKAAAVLARTLDDLEPLDDKVYKCKFTLFNGQRCIEQFTDAEHLSKHYRKCPGVKSYQHFRVSEDNAGSISYKVHSSSDEQTVGLSRSEPSPTLTAIIPPPGIDATRSLFLF